MRLLNFAILGIFLSSCAKPSELNDNISRSLESGRWVIVESNDPQIPASEALPVSFDFAESEISVTLGALSHGVKFIWFVDNDSTSNFIQMDVYGAADSEVPTRTVRLTIVSNVNGVMQLADTVNAFNYKAVIESAELNLLQELLPGLAAN